MYQDCEEITVTEDEVAAACALLLLKKIPMETCILQASELIGAAEMETVIKAHTCCFTTSVVTGDLYNPPSTIIQQNDNVEELQTSVFLSPKSPGDDYNNTNCDSSLSDTKVLIERTLSTDSFDYNIKEEKGSIYSRNSFLKLEDKENINSDFSAVDVINGFEIENSVNGLDYVILGANGTVLLRTTYESLNWSTAKKATRGMLRALLPRYVLATHSLSGHRSPAFPNLPRKDRLLPEVVDDIVSNITERFEVSERHVRSAITIACADEAKLYRVREQQRRIANKRRTKRLY